MININSVTLVGRITKDIELRKTSSNTSVCNFTVAVDRRFQSQQNGGQSADFINCIAWRQSADFLSSYASKGTIVAVEGRIQTRSYTNRDGQKVYTTDVVVEDQEFAESKGASNGATATAPAPASAPAPAARKAAPAKAAPGPEGFMNIPEGDEEDLPWNS